jgi:hypothetical protein
MLTAAIVPKSYFATAGFLTMTRQRRMTSILPAFGFLKQSGAGLQLEGPPLTV